MSTGSIFTIRRASWLGDLEGLRSVREAVFVREQHVPVGLEWDGKDPQCDHVVAEAGGRAVGTGRLLADGHIGRMAVLPAWRRKGVGSAILTELVVMASQRGLRAVVLHAQVRARTFYERHGFCVEGEEFVEAGIAHLKMVRVLD